MNDRATAVWSLAGLGLCIVCDQLIGSSGVVTNEHDETGAWYRSRAYHETCYDGSAGPVLNGSHRTAPMTPAERGRRVAAGMRRARSRREAVKP